jgi:hypothetical protein
VTLSAEELTASDSQFEITEPRLLNGAQTVTTFARFLKANEGNQLLNTRRDVLESINVMCRVITNASPEFVTTVTINNNRQNPVNPWNLRANDMIQLQLQDKFRDDLEIYYARQEGAFENLSDEDLEELGITHYKAMELTRSPEHVLRVTEISTSSATFGRFSSKIAFTIRYSILVG